MKTLFIILCLAFTGTANAQGWDEWFNQKNTQKRYLIKQIALLNNLRTYTSKGYRIVEDGLRAVGGYTEKEWDEHARYFRSMYVVNPAIRNSIKVEQIRQMHYRISANRQQVYMHMIPSEVLTEDEVRYIRRVYDRLQHDCETAMEDVNQILTDGRLQMSDDERLKRIDELHKATVDRLGFSRQFMATTQALVAARKREQRDIERSLQQHGIKF